MPQRRTFRGCEVKNAKRIMTPKGAMIRVTFVGQKGKPGQQVTVTPEEYESGLTRTFKPGVASTGGNH